MSRSNLELEIRRGMVLEPKPFHPAFAFAIRKPGVDFMVCAGSMDELVAAWNAIASEGREIRLESVREVAVFAQHHVTPE